MPMNPTNIKSSALFPPLPIFNTAPQFTRSLGSDFRLSKSVNLIGGSTADAPAVNLLKKVLSDNNIDINALNVQGCTTIFIGELSNSQIGGELSALNLQPADDMKSEGYIVGAKAVSSGNSIIVLAGKDDAGIFYAVQTFRQMLKTSADGVLCPQVEIRDYPSMPIRGVIESFYGTPWTQAQRLNQISYYGSHKLNTYVYASKNDPYLRSDWRNPYPADDLNIIKQLVDASDANHVNFVFAISPAAAQSCIHFDDPAKFASDFTLLETKAQSVYDVGVRNFAILLDDIDNKNASDQAMLLNKFESDFIETHPGAKPLLMIPAAFCNAMLDDKTYTNEMAAALDPKITVMWTGAGVVPATIDSSDIKTADALYNRKMLIWWNYPVNDFCTNSLLLGPAAGLDRSLDGVTCGLLSNPMIEPESSKIALFTVADYTWNPAAYNSSVSWNNAIDEFGGNADASAALKIFADHSSACAMNGCSESVEIKDDLKELLRKINTDDEIASLAAKVKTKFAAIQAAPSTLRTKLDNPEFLTETKDWLDKLELFGRAGQDSVDMILAIRRHDIDGYWDCEQDAIDALRQIDANPVIIADQVIDPYIRNVMKSTESILLSQLRQKTDKVCKFEVNSVKANQMLTNMAVLKGVNAQNGLTEDGCPTVFWNSDLLISLPVNGYFGIQLSDIQYVQSIHIKMDARLFAKGVVEYSYNRNKWYTIGSATNSGTITLNQPAAAKYIRFRATVAVQSVIVSEFTVSLQDSAIRPTPFANLIAYQNYGIQNVNDGNKTTFLWGSYTGRGEYVGVNLGSLRLVRNIRLVMGVGGHAGDYIHAGQMQSSTDGKTWSDVGAVQNGAIIEMTGLRIKAQYLRYISNEVQSTWATVDEFAVNTAIAYTNIDVNQGTADNLLDKDDNTSVGGSFDSNSSGAFFAEDLGRIQTVTAIKLNMGSAEYIRNGQMETSVNGTDWTPVGGPDNTSTVEKSGLSVKARYVRYRSLEPQEEAITATAFDVTANRDFYKISGTPAPAGGSDFSYMVDNNLLTSYTAANAPVNGDSLTYLIPDDKAAASFYFFQSKDAVSNAVVKAENANGTWRQIGILNKPCTVLDVPMPGTIIAISINWDANAKVVPQIYEIYIGGSSSAPYSISN